MKNQLTGAYGEDIYIEVPLGTIAKNEEGEIIAEILEDGQEITVSPGSLTEEEKKFYFENKGRIIGRITKYKFFPKGMKDKPRFPNHQSFRMERCAR